MEKKFFDDLKTLIHEVEGKPGQLAEATIPVAARNLQELTERVTKSWNRAYGEFAQARNAAYDIAATFNISTRVTAGPKEVKNITRDSEESLITTISWVADRFRKDYQKDVVKRGGDLRAHADRLSEIAHRAKDTSDRDLHEATLTFIKEFLAFRTAVSDHLYRSVGGIARRAEELINRYLPPENRPSKPPGGARGPRYTGTILETSGQVGDRADDIIEHLDTFIRLSEPTIEEVEKIAQLSDEIARELPSQEPPPEDAETGHPTEAMKEKGAHKRKRISDWFELKWEQDPEIGVFF